MMHQEGKEDLIDRPSFFAQTFSMSNAPEGQALRFVLKFPRDTARPAVLYDRCGIGLEVDRIPA